VKKIRAYGRRTVRTAITEQHWHQKTEAGVVLFFLHLIHAVRGKKKDEKTDVTVRLSGWTRPNEITTGEI